MTIYTIRKEKDAMIERVNRDHAVSLLDSYWQDAESCLDDGAVLWTPFAYYATTREAIGRELGIKEVAHA